YGDLVRGFIGQISHLGDMVPVMAGVTLSFKMRKQDRVGLVYVGDGATSTGAFHEGINFAAVQKCPLVVIVENNGYAYSTPLSEHFDQSEVAAIDARVTEEIDRATDEAEASPMPDPTDALVGIYADPPVLAPLWFREGIKSAVEVHERPAGWGTHDV